MVLRFIKKHFFLILAVLIAVSGYFYISAVGKEYEYVRDDYNSSSGITDVKVYDDSTGMAEIVKWETTEKELKVRLKSTSPGKVYLYIDCPEKPGVGVFHIHNNGVITNSTYFGDCTGSGTLILWFALYLTAILAFLVVKYFMLEERSFYSYDNVLYLGLIIFAVFFIYSQIRSIFYKAGINGAFYQSMISSQNFVIFTLPLVIVTTVFVTFSNIRLIRKEGRTWKNMLGVILGLTLGIGAYMPMIINSILQKSSLIDVHYQRGIGSYFETFLESTAASIVAYLECRALR